MKKILLLVLALVIILAIVSCEPGGDTSISNDVSNAQSETQQTESNTEASAEESTKSILDMTTEELDAMFGDIDVLDLSENTGEMNVVIDVDLKQTGLTESYKVIIDEKTSIRGDSTIKRSYYQNIIGYQLDEKAELIFDDGMAYIYSDNGKFKSSCSLDEFHNYLWGDDENEDIEPDYTIKATEATDEYVILELNLEITDNSTKYSKDYLEGIIPILLGIEEFDDFTLVSCVQKTKIVGDFIEKIEEEYVAKITALETEYEVKIVGIGEYSEKDPIITIPENDSEYFELPKISAVSDLSTAIDEFYNDEFISFTQKSDFKITSKNENYTSKSTENVRIIHPDGILKFRIISDSVDQGVESQTITTYNGVKLETSFDGEKESFTLSADEAYGALANYYATFMLADVNNLVSVTAENENVNFTITLSDEMFEGIAYSLIYSLFADPSNVQLNESVKKDVFFEIKGSELVSGGYNLEFTCNVENETYTMTVSLELDNIKQIDESAKELDA